MPRYIRKGSADVDAMQFSKDKALEQGVTKVAYEKSNGDLGYSYYFNTPKGRVSLSEGDWIVRDGINFSVCTDEYFKREYMPLKSTTKNCPRCGCTADNWMSDCSRCGLRGF